MLRKEVFYKEITVYIILATSGDSERRRTSKIPLQIIAYINEYSLIIAQVWSP